MGLLTLPIFHLNSSHGLWSPCDRFERHLVKAADQLTRQQLNECLQAVLAVKCRRRWSIAS